MIHFTGHRPFICGPGVNIRSSFTRFNSSVLLAVFSPAGGTLGVVILL